MRRHGAIETSVLVVTDDHPPDLERYARALLAQREAGPYEIVLVDVIGSTDYASAFAEIAAGLDDPPPCRFLRLPGAGRARGCNAARDAASPDASLVVFFADDFIAPARLVAAHRAFHRERPEAETVGIGAALLPEAIANDPFARWLEASGELYGAPFHHGMTGIPSDFFYVGNASVKRAFLERAGRSDDRFRHHAVDDHELGVRLLRLGMRAGYVADALAEHCHPVTLRERREVMRRAGEAARIYETTHGTHPSWRRVLSRAPWRHRLDAWRYRVRHALTGSTRQRERYFRSLLRESLSAGYREARRDA